MSADDRFMLSVRERSKAVREGFRGTNSGDLDCALVSSLVFFFDFSSGSCFTCSFVDKSFEFPKNIPFYENLYPNYDLYLPTLQVCHLSGSL